MKLSLVLCGAINEGLQLGPLAAWAVLGLILPAHCASSVKNNLICRTPCQSVSDGFINAERQGEVNEVNPHDAPATSHYCPLMAPPMPFLSVSICLCLSIHAALCLSLALSLSLCHTLSRRLSLSPPVGSVSFSVTHIFSLALDFFLSFGWL